jgi:hypothetical protein
MSGSGLTTNSISLTSITSYSIFYVITFLTGLTDTGSSAFARPFQLAAGSPAFFMGMGRAAYTTAVSGASIASPTTTTYNVTNTTGLTTGKTVTIAGITLGSATGYNGTGVVQSFVTSTSVTVSITSTGTPTSFVGATARNGTDNVGYYEEGNAGSGPFFFYAFGQGFNTYAGNTFVVSFSQTGATSYVLSVNGNASALTAATATMRNRQVSIGGNGGLPLFELGEVLLYDGALSTQDRQRVESYLIWKWKAQRTSYPGANTNFRTTHPFYKFPTPTTTPFDPRIITGIFGWYDGADVSTISFSGSNMNLWKDKSGNGYNLTSTAGPVRLETSTNPCGVDIVFLSAFNQFISRTSGISLTGVTTFSCFVVLKDLGDATFFGRFVSAGTTTDVSSDNTGFSIAHQTTNASIVIQKFQATGPPYTAITQSALVSSPSASYSIISFTSGTQLASFLNGTQVSSSPQTLTSPTYNFTQFAIGRGVSTGSPLNGVVNEVVTYTTTLTPTERRQVEGYLAWKWGLQASLPTTHPYYKVPI